MPMRCLIKTYKIIYYIYTRHTIIHIYILFYKKIEKSKTKQKSSFSSFFNYYFFDFLFSLFLDKRKSLSHFF